VFEAGLIELWDDVGLDVGLDVDLVESCGIGSIFVTLELVDLDDMGSRVLVVCPDVVDLDVGWDFLECSLGSDDLRVGIELSKRRPRRFRPLGTTIGTTHEANVLLKKVVVSTITALPKRFD
jgi:hypothetical protein